MIPVFIATLTVLVELHHPTSWPTPTLAVALSCIGLILFVKTAIGLGKTLVADVHPALAMLAMLAAEVITWLMSCWLLRRKTVRVTTLPSNRTGKIPAPCLVLSE
jgi:hypothetical protein